MSSSAVRGKRNATKAALPKIAAMNRIFAMPWTPSPTHLSLRLHPDCRAHTGVSSSTSPFCFRTQPELRHGSCLEHLGEDALLLIQFDNTRGRGDPIKKFVSRSFPSLHYGGGGEGVLLGR